MMNSVFTSSASSSRIPSLCGSGRLDSALLVKWYKLEDLLGYNFLIWKTGIIFYLIFMLYWRIVDLQYCVSFRCTTKSLSYTCIHIHSFSDSFPIIEYWVEFPVLYSRSLWTIHSLYTSEYLSVPNSQSNPPLYLGNHKSCFWSLWVCYVHLYHFLIQKKCIKHTFGNHKSAFEVCESAMFICIIVLDSTYTWYHRVFVFLCLTYFTWYDNLQVHSCCYKWCYFILPYGWVKIPLCVCPCLCW